MARLDKKVMQGDDTLIPCKWWPKDLSQLIGQDPDVLQSPVIEYAFNRILDLHQPRSSLAVMSLCTMTRPYSRGRKWSTLDQRYGAIADMIVCSNGGIIPLVFETEFPYLNYDAHGQKQFDALYIQITAKRLIQFFDTFRQYTHAIFLFRPALRNVRAVLEAALGIPHLKFRIMPNEALYNKAKVEGFSQFGVKYYPELHPTILHAVDTAVTEWGFKL